MTVSVREAGPFERLVGFELSDAEIEAAKAATARRLAQDLKLKGFRPGKAPRPVVEAAVGADRLRSEAIEDAIPAKLSEVLAAEAIHPAVNPELENMEDIEGGVSVEVKVTLWPQLDAPPAYQDRKIEIESPEVTDDEVESQLDRMREQFGQVEEVERPAGEGDFVSVDITGTVDGEEIEAARATELLYRIGTGGLLEGADEVLVGTEAGAEVTLESPLPEGFGEESGKTAEFKIMVNEVKELILPELTNEWVDENTEFDSVDELRSTLRQRMADAKESTLARRFSDRTLETLVEQVEIDLPEAVVRAEMDEILHRFVHRLEEQEVSLADYFEATGVSREQFLADLNAQADRSLRTRVLLDAIISDAGLQVEDSEIDQLLHAAAAQSEDPMGFLKAVRGTPQELSLRSDMLRDKALKLILDHATPVDADGNVIDIDLGVEEGGDTPASPAVEGAAVEGEVVEGEVVEGEVVEGEVVMGEVVEGQAAPPDTVEGETVAGADQSENGDDAATSQEDSGTDEENQ
ncbi:MAG TPA: trigger factor [Acidimicrobiia bacterium]|nr:trigger factor [Acidimicrobiia bacterium]